MSYDLLFTHIFACLCIVIHLYNFGYASIFLSKDTESDEVLDGVLSYLCFDIKKNLSWLWHVNIKRAHFKFLQLPLATKLSENTT